MALTRDASTFSDSGQETGRDGVLSTLYRSERIMLKHFSEVFQRDNHRCVYCGRDMMADFDSFMITQMDHLEPLSEDGEDGPDNVVTTCAVCNSL